MFTYYRSGLIFRIIDKSSLEIFNIFFFLPLQKKKSPLLKAGAKALGSLWGDKTAIFG